MTAVDDRSKTVVVCCLGTLTVNLNNTALNLAVASIRADFRLSMVAMEWVAAAYTLTLAALVMLAGSLGDRFNKRSVVSLGVVLYTLGSALGAMAPNWQILAASRVLAAVGASAMVPVGLAVVRLTARTSKQLAGYMSIWAVAVGAGMALGPIVGGLTTGLAGWRALFLLMAALGGVFLFLALRFIPDIPGDSRRRIGWTSQALLALWVGALVATLIQLTPGSSAVPLMIAGGLFVLGFVGWMGCERYTALPVLPVGARVSSVWLPLLVALCNYTSLGIALFAGSLYAQDRLGLDAATAGATFIPLAVATACGGHWAGRALVGRGYRLVTSFSGAAVLTGAILVLITVAVVQQVSVTGLIAGTALIGLGVGGANTPVNIAVTDALPAECAGLGGSLASSSRQLGQAAGVAIAGIMMSGRSAVHSFAPPASSYAMPFVVIGGCGIVLVVLGRCYRLLDETRAVRVKF